MTCKPVDPITRMPLTRHLYELDEVISALQLCLSTKEDAGLFWLWELVVSKEEAVAASLLDYDAYTEATAEDWITQYQIHGVTGRRPTKRIHNRLDIAAAFAAATEFWLGLDDACQRKNIVAAIWYLKNTTLSSDQIRKALTMIDPTIPTCKPVLSAVYHYCVPKAKKWCDLWDSWNKQIGRRAARLYAIPEAALTPTTTRGSLPRKYTNIADIREPVALLSEGCTFWKEVMMESGGHFKDDDSLEKFYATYFPDDIPDEWSLADQQKSHGRGMQKS